MSSQHKPFISSGGDRKVGMCYIGERWEPRWDSQVVLVVKNPPANAGDLRDMDSIPGSGRSPGEENGNPFQYSFLENPMDRGA